jgi:hypothetical protein
MTLPNNLISYIINNKEWIFSGIGVSAIAWLYAAIRRSKPSAKQTINSGARSKNVQALGNINISTNRKK